SLAAIVHITEESKQLVQRGSRRARVDSWWNQPSIREPFVFSRSTLIPNSRYHRGGSSRQRGGGDGRRFSCLLGQTTRPRLFSSDLNTGVRRMRGPYSHS